MHYTSINTSILLGDLPIPQQLEIARDHGFTEVELWWPFATPDPSVREVDEFLSMVGGSGLSLIGLNTYEGGMAEGNRGVACWPGAEGDVRASVAVAKRIGVETGCRSFNVLHGVIRDGVPRDEQDALAAQNTSAAAHELAEIDAVVTIEQLSHIPGYGLRTFESVLQAIDRARGVDGAGNIMAQVDLFHMYQMGEDVPSLFRQHWDRIAHVQVADQPGRGGPGTGVQPIDAHLAVLREAGYTGRFTLEYSWAGPDDDPFGWMGPRP